MEVHRRMFSVNYVPNYYRPNKRRRQKVIRKRRIKTLTEAIASAWKDFCTTSSFVGFRYIYRAHRSIIDVIFWSLLMVVLMYCSISFVVIFLDRYHSLSTTTVVQTHHRPTSRSVFPAVTACLGNRVNKKMFNAFIGEYLNSINDGKLSNHNLTEADFVKILDMNKFPDSNTFTATDMLLSTYNLTLGDMMARSTNDCEEIFTICRFAGEITPCSRIFKRTSGGFCCSFNYPISKEAILKRKYLRTKTFGIHGGLSFAFKTFPDEDYYQKINYGNTLRVALHPSHSFPSLTLNNFFMSTSMETALEISSVYNTADNKVKNLPTEDRDCIFAFEKFLPNFVRYSYSNCLLQCKIDGVKRNCGCVPHFYPTNDESEVCPTKQLRCSIESRFVETESGEKRVISDDHCDCPDDCSIIKQYAKIESWDFSTISNYSVDDFYEKVTDDQGIVHIFHGKSTVLHLQRKIAFDEIELASNIGGIVAIFLGCSFVSVIEIIYFFTLRLMKFLQLKKSENY